MELTGRRTLATLATFSAVALLIGGITVMVISHTGPNEGGAVDSAHVHQAADVGPSPQWIIDGARPQSSDISNNADQNTHSAPRAEHSGTIITRLEPIAKKLVPAGSTKLSGTQYPDLNAATLTFSGPNGQKYSVSVERLKSPMYISDITLGLSSDHLQSWQSGSQAVIVEHGMPHTFQVVMTRPNGTMISFSVTDGAQQASTQMLQPWLSSEDLVNQFKTAFNNTTVDSIVG